MTSPTPFKVIKNEIAHLELYEKYIVSSINEEIIIDENILHWLVMLFDKYYPNKNFAYITNRVNQYSLNPMVYPLMAMHKGLQAMAIVSYTDLGKQTALYEKGFFKKPLNIFSNTEQAIHWVLSMVCEKKKVDL